MAVRKYPHRHTHVRYWRSIDNFFLPGLSSAETGVHVGRMHGAAFQKWADSMLFGGSADIWKLYLESADVATSFEYIRTHQRRLIGDFYGASQAHLFDSLWKFGGSLLPADPQSRVFPEHRMNSTLDWFFWVPYLDVSLRAADCSELDVALARAWQVGIVADGLLRTDAERPAAARLPIPDFLATDPQLPSKVIAKYDTADPSQLFAEMLRRAKESRLFGSP